MRESTENVNIIEEEDFSFNELVKARKADLRYILQFKKQLAVALVAGAVLGALFAWKWPVTYTARTTFVVEETKAGGGGMMSALAGQIGLDIGSMAGSGGVLAGDNVLELLKSRKIIKQALLRPYDKTQCLADKYAQVYQLKEKWKKYTNGALISLPADPSKYSRLQDSLMQVIIFRIEDKELGVRKVDKKLTFFELTADMRDEKLAQLFAVNLIDQATDFYINTKTGKLRSNVDRLQHRADSITRILNRKTYSASAANGVLLDLNPAYAGVNAGIEVKQRDKAVLSTIYSEVIKNLEVNKTMLIQETPTFQLVDEPELPLKKHQIKYPIAIVVGMFLAGLAYALFLLLTKR